jgi:hypothetical protein
MPIRKIAETIRMTECTISRYRKRAGLPPLQKGIVSREDEVVGFIKEHPEMTYRDMYEAIGISYGSLYYYCKKVGWKPRSKDLTSRYDEFDRFTMDHPYMSRRDVSKALGISYSVFNKFCKETGRVQKKASKYLEAIEFNKSLRENKKENPGWR